MPESTLTKLTNVVIAICAVALTWRLVFGGGAETSRSVNRQEVPNWEEVVGAGHLVGERDAPIQFVVFEDFECPICGVFARESMPGIRARYPGQVAFTIRHYPLDYHRAANFAAIGGECAANQQWFAQYRAHLFANHAGRRSHTDHYCIYKQPAGCIGRQGKGGGKA